MDPTSLATDASALELQAPPGRALELVSGSSAPHHEPIARGLRAIRDVLGASDSVLFSVLPQGLQCEAASGPESARLAHRLMEAGGALDLAIDGPCALAFAGDVCGDLDGLARRDPPVGEVVVLGDRLHRGRALAVAVWPGTRPVPGFSVRFAHAIFRDLLRWRRDRDPGPPGRGRGPSDGEEHRFGALVGATRPMRRLFRTIEKLAVSDVNVLVLGESGTGKELVARAIHETGSYAGRRFVAQNCAALPEALLESELFGHCRGAFTGANTDKRGLFEEADGGTFFLDEIADMPMALQIKMLRVLQDGEIRRVGETRTRQVSVRVVAATNKRLGEEVARGRFREDLYHRLNVVKLELVPLRRRKEDVPLLARAFGERLGARLGRPPLEFSAEARQRLLDYDWPGNVRELQNEIERLVALHGDEEVIKPYMLSERLRYGSAADFSLGRLDEMRNLNQATEYLERALIARSLERHGWNKSRAAIELGVSRQGLIKKIQRLELVRPGPPRPAAPAVEDEDVESTQTEFAFAPG